MAKHCTFDDHNACTLVKKRGASLSQVTMNVSTGCDHMLVNKNNQSTITERDVLVGLQFITYALVCRDVEKSLNDWHPQRGVLALLLYCERQFTGMVWVHFSP